jgi:hypothetical protein
MKPVVVDTSVWRGFFAGRTAARPLGELLSVAGVVLVHPLVVGELVLGGLAAVEEKLLYQLPRVERVDYPQVLAVIRHHRLVRKGIGWVDAELLASTLLSKALLWSLDISLAAAALELEIACDLTQVL